MSIIESWINKGYLTREHLSSCVGNNKSSLLHWISFFNPKSLKFIIEHDPNIFDDFIFYRDLDGMSPLHVLAKDYPVMLVEWVKKNYISVQKLICVQSLDGTSIVHILAQHHPRVLESWLDQELVFFKELLEPKTTTNLSVFDFLEFHALNPAKDKKYND